MEPDEKADSKKWTCDQKSGKQLKLLKYFI